MPPEHAITGEDTGKEIGWTNILIVQAVVNPFSRRESHAQKCWWRGSWRSPAQPPMQSRVTRVAIEGRSGKASLLPFLIQVFLTVVLSVLMLEEGIPNSNPLARKACGVKACNAEMAGESFTWRSEKWRRF